MTGDRSCAMAEVGENAVLSRSGLDGLLRVLAQDYRVIGPTLRDGRSSTTRSSASPICRAAGPTSRTAATTGCSGATTMRCSATPSARSPGSGSCTRRRSGCGAPSGRGTAARDRAGKPEPARALRLHRRARLRARRDRDPGPGVPRRRRHVDPHLPAPARRRVHRRGATAARRAAPASAPRWAPDPGATRGFDLALTELIGGGRHDFLVEVGSDRGAAMLAELPHRASDAEPRARRAPRSRRAHGRSAMGRAMLDTDGLQELLQRNSSIRAGTRSPSAA